MKKTEIWDYLKAFEVIPDIIFLVQKIKTDTTYTNSAFYILLCKKEKNMLRHSSKFLLPCITVEEHFIISIAFIFKIYFLCFVANELSASIIIV